MPGFVPPQLASLRSKPPAGDNWLHEIKYDGYRLQIHLDKGRVTIRTRTKARAGEVLVSSAVKDLMSQSGIRFKDRGVHQLKGVPKRWRLYGVEH